MESELERIEAAYAARLKVAGPSYALIEPFNYMVKQERERALLQWCRDHLKVSISDARILEIGCGSGGNLLELLRIGFKPLNLVGNELLPERIEAARKLLPNDIKVLPGSASDLDLELKSFDTVLQSTVFTSILDRTLQEGVAKRMWELVKPGGGVLWYDFVFDNPKNPNVRGVSVDRIKQLFPGQITFLKRVTLAPPIGRRLARIHPALYTIANALPFLRTHVLCYIKKV